MGLVLNSGPQILFPMLGHLPCPSSLLLAPGCCGRSKSRSSPVLFQAGINKNPQPQRFEAEKGKETTPKRASKPTRSQGAAAASSLSAPRGRGRLRVAPLGVPTGGSAGCPPWRSRWVPLPSSPSPCTYRLQLQPQAHGAGCWVLAAGCQAASEGAKQPQEGGGGGGGGMEEGAGCVWAVGDEGGRLPWPWLTQAIARALRGPAAMRLPPPLPRRGDEDGDTELGRGGGAH